MKRTRHYDILPLNADNAAYRAYIESQLRDELLGELWEECVDAEASDIVLTAARRRSVPGVRGPVLRVTATYNPPPPDTPLE